MTRSFKTLIKNKPEGAVFFGDWHGDTYFAIKALERAIERYPDIDVFYHVGDFGIWPEDERYVATVTSIMSSADKLLVVTGGNHEDWDRWDTLTKNQTQPYVFPGESLVLLPKLYKWVHAGRTFTSVGGASSIDRFRREEGTSWWPQEEIAESVIETVERKDYRADILITHESSDDPVPPVVDVLNNPFAQGQWPQDAIEVSEVQRKYVSRAVDAVMPQYHFHGHWHVPFVRTRDMTTVSLAANFASLAENTYAIEKFD